MGYLAAQCPLTLLVLEVGHLVTTLRGTPWSVRCSGRGYKRVLEPVRHSAVSPGRRSLVPAGSFVYLQTDEKDKIF
jgi:hypothetical protein